MSFWPRPRHRSTKTVAPGPEVSCTSPALPAVFALNRHDKGSGRGWYDRILQQFLIGGGAHHFIPAAPARARGRAHFARMSASAGERVPISSSETMVVAMRSSRYLLGRARQTDRQHGFMPRMRHAIRRASESRAAFPPRPAIHAATATAPAPARRSALSHFCCPNEGLPNLRHERDRRRRFPPAAV